MTIFDDIAAAFEADRPGQRDGVWLPKGSIRLLRGIPIIQESPNELLWLCALLLTILERGGSCLPINEISHLAEVTRLPVELQSWSEDQWRTLLLSPAVGDGVTDVRPLVFTNNRLYFDKYFRLEMSVATSLREPLGTNALDQPESWNQTVRTVFGDNPRYFGQKHFASELFSSRVSVLAGGPGTGKTHTVAKTLIALHQATEGRATVKLCAPTGKAAARIKESLLDAMDHMAESAGTLRREEQVALRETLNPVTIHKLLNITPIASRRRTSAPLHADFIICDETSMVDLSLLAELLRAVSPDTRIILVGDPNQLQSVDVGTVMSDLVLSIDYGLSGVQLTEVLRVDDDARDLLPFFNSIRNGDVAAAVEAIERGVAGLEHVQPNVLRDSGLLEAVFQRAENLRDAGHRGASAREFRPILESTMVLTAQHNGSLSRNEWKDSVAKHLGWDLLPSPSQIGLPVLITRTDHANGLTNGDTGLIVTLGDGETAVYQPTNDASDGSGNEIVTTLPPASIHDWQPWWAMTIHKSQGSEFSHVIVSITPGTRLLSRELLYTAVTRAKKRVSIVCDIEDFKLAINKPATRFSGLAEIIAQLVSATALP